MMARVRGRFFFPFSFFFIVSSLRGFPLSATRKVHLEVPTASIFCRVQWANSVPLVTYYV